MTKWFVVSEEELEAAIVSANIVGWGNAKYGYCGDSVEKEYEKAEAACRSRPVPEWATHFADLRPSIDPSEPIQIWNYEEISK